MKRLVCLLVAFAVFLGTTQAKAFEFLSSPRSLKWGFYSTLWLGLACDALQDGYTWGEIYGYEGDRWLVHSGNWHTIKTIKNASYFLTGANLFYSLYSEKVDKRTMTFRSLTGALIGWVIWDEVYWRTRYGTWNRYTDQRSHTLVFFKFKNTFPYITELHLPLGPEERLIWDAGRLALGFYLLGKDRAEEGAFEPNIVDKYFLQQVEKYAEMLFREAKELLKEKVEEAEEPKGEENAGQKK